MYCDACSGKISNKQQEHSYLQQIKLKFNPLNAELNPVRHLLALVEARHIVHVSRIRVKSHPPFASIGRSSPYSPC